MIIGLMLTIVLLPFVQIGLSYYLSVQSVAFVAILSSSRNNAKLIFTEYFLLRAAASIGLLCAVLLYFSYSYERLDGQNISRAVREVVFFFVITGLSAVSFRIDIFWYRRVRNAIAAIAIVMLMLVVVQSIFLSRGIYVGLPQELFVINTETLPDELDLIYSSIRPMGTFGEPSYLAAMCFALIFGLRRMWSVDRAARIVIILLILISLFSRSFSGIVSTTVLLVFLISRSRHALIIYIVGAWAAALGLLLIAMLGLGVFDRLLDIFSGNDYAASVRVTEPFFALPKIVANYPWGIPPLILREYEFLRDPVIETKYLVQNGFFNFIINYGVFGAAALACIFYIYRGIDNSFFLAVLMFQNGSPLAIDKVVMIAVAMALSNSISPKNVMEATSKASTRRSRASQSSTINSPVPVRS